MLNYLGFISCFHKMLLRYPYLNIARSISVICKGPGPTKQEGSQSVMRVQQLTPHTEAAGGQ